MHRNKNGKLLHRFYEPLVLLRVLNPSTKLEDRLPDLPLTGDEDYRTFLDQLAWICDREPGGTKVTAVAAEADPSGPIYWLTYPGSCSEKTRSHVEQTLDTLKAAWQADTERLTELEDTLFRRFVAFSHKKVKNYRQLLRKRIQRCQQISIGEVEGRRIFG